VRIAGLVEYDGTDFAGWARQPQLRTVEASLTEALETVLRHPVKLSVAGRTDAGVHASGQVISFDTNTDLQPTQIAYKATAILPKDVALRRCVNVLHDFDARYNARGRRYEYRVLNGGLRSPLERHRSVYIARYLDFGLLQDAAKLVEGIHDFRAFTPSKSYHRRFTRAVEESRWTRDGDLLTYHVAANSFLHGMVRSLVGTMWQVAEGKRDLADFERLLRGVERSVAGPAAPSRGLTLVSVEYERDPWREV
jgi:tRNA pseudouridine38-40 synthase